MKPENIHTANDALNIPIDALRSQDVRDSFLDVQREDVLFYVGNSYGIDPLSEPEGARDQITFMRDHSSRFHNYCQGVISEAYEQKWSEDLRINATTGMKNKLAWREALTGLLEGEKPAALLLLDIDKFKKANDRLGHPKGDELLRLVAHRLADVLREDDIVAYHLSGDEFAVLVSDLSHTDLVAHDRERSGVPEHAPTRRGSETLSHIEKVEKLITRLRSEIGEVFIEEFDGLGLDVSIGYAISDLKTSAQELIVQADKGLYVDKAKHKTEARKRMPRCKRFLGDLGISLMRYTGQFDDRTTN